MIKLYKFNYDDNASCEFEVNTDKFTKEKALDTLAFFSWNYDKDNDPVDEVMKKYAILVFEKTSLYWFDQLQEKEFEGFYKMNGSEGILLKEVTDYEFNEDLLSVKITVRKN